jgi:hypothetical protein
VFPRQSEVQFALVVFMLSIIALIFSGQLIIDPPISLDSNLLAMNSRAFPLLILVSTVVVSFIMLVNVTRETNLYIPRKNPGISAEVPNGYWQQGLFLIITITCALLLTTLGFIATMFLLMVSTAILVGNRNIFQILSVSILIPLCFYIVVTRVLRTSLPETDIVQRFLGPLIRLLPAF